MFGYAPFLGKVRISPMTGSFGRIPFQQSPVRPILMLSQAQTPGVPKTQAEVDRETQEEQILRQAATKMISTGNNIAYQLESTYNKYKSTGNYWLIEAAATFVFGPFPLVTGTADVWWQSSRENEAVAALQAIQYLANAWMLDMSEKWLPTFIDDIDKLDPGLSRSISSTFDRVSRDYAQNNQLLSGVKMLPPDIVVQAASAFFGSLNSNLKDLEKTMIELMKALAALTKAAGESVGLLAKLAQAAPYAVLGIGVLGVGYYFLKS